MTDHAAEAAPRKREPSSPKTEPRLNGSGHETKRQAFVRLATKRTEVLIDRIRVLSNCSNPYAYEYTEEDVRKIFGAIDKELKAARLKFQQNEKRSFTLE